MSTTGSEGGTPASWLADPMGRHELRYWDGSTWTDSVSDAGATSTDPISSGPPASSVPTQATAPSAGYPPGDYTAAPAPYYQQPVAGYGYAARGPIGHQTTIGTQILLTIVTLGIFALIWTYRQYKEFKDYSGEGLGGGIGILLGILTGVVTFFVIPSELSKNLYEREGQQCPVSVTTGFWAFLPFAGGIIWYLKVQAAINQFWAAKGAPPP